MTKAQYNQFVFENAGMGLYPTRYYAEKARDKCSMFDGSEKVVKVCGGYKLMTPYEYEVFRYQK